MPSPSVSKMESHGSVGSNPLATSQPSGIPSLSESFAPGFINSRFAYRPGEEPVNTVVFPSTVIVCNVTISPKTSSWFWKPYTAE